MRSPLWVAIAWVAVSACGSQGEAGVAHAPPGGGFALPDAGPAHTVLPDAGPPDAGPPDAGHPPDAGVIADPGPLPCPPLYAQDALPTFRIEIGPAEWAELEDEFLHRAERLAQGLDPHPWHPIVFRYESEEFPDAMLRLKGQSSWTLTVQNDPNPRMQFVVSFNEVDPKRRFRGLRKLVLDMPRNDRTFLRQRLALSYLRDAGIPAQCANNARVEINGAYYGLFANLEHLDKEFLGRVFRAGDEGDLWKGGSELKTNEETSTRQRRKALYAATTVAQVDKLADLEQAVEMWAADAMLPNGDGYFAGTLNFMLYDHPDRGFLWLPHDLDGTFYDFATYDADPISFLFAPEKPLHWRILMADPGWRARYVDALEAALDGYDVQALQQRVTAWAAQIEQAASDDPRRPFSFEEHQRHVRYLRNFLAQRKAFVREWLQACDRRVHDVCP